MKKLLILALVLGVVAAFAMPAVALKAPANMTFDAPAKSPVPFNHAAHESVAGDCKSCHHYGVGNGTCTGCHGVSDQAPTLKRALHQNCKNCHQTMGVSGRRDCAFCHK